MRVRDYPSIGITEESTCRDSRCLCFGLFKGFALVASKHQIYYSIYLGVTRFSFFLLSPHRKTFLTLIYISLFTIFSLSIHFSPSSCTYAHTHARLRRSSHQHTSVSLSFFLVLLATLVCDCNKEIFFSYWDNVFCRLLVTTFLILLPHQIRMTFKC